MTSLNRINDLTVFEGYSKVLGGQVHLHFAIRGKPNFPVIATRTCRIGSGERLDRDVIKTKHLRVEVVQTVHIFGHKVDVVELKFHG